MPSNRLNFSAGPGALPETVLRQAQQAVVALPDTGLSVLGMSHRSAWFEALLDDAERTLRALLAVPDRYRVLFLQGGGSLQFSMIPMNFAAAAEAVGTGPAARPAYLRTGYWSAKAIAEARCAAPLEVVWDGADGGYRTLPELARLPVGANAAYCHYVSNETVEGLQFDAGAAPPPGVRAIVDMSSDLLSRPVDVGAYAMIYAHAQKNLGPAGVTVCLVDEALLARIPDGLPPMLDYRTHAAHGSNYNTPPVFGIYVLALVARWLRDDIGGVAAMAEINRRKADAVYGALDRNAALIDAHAERRCRSRMNVAFGFRDARLDASFVAAAEAAGFVGLAGHRSRGGVRASLYNAVEEAAALELAEFIDGFCRARA